jgi:tetrahydromethanopterin S-methyltransferase subunit B
VTHHQRVSAEGARRLERENPHRDVGKVDGLGHHRATPKVHHFKDTHDPHVVAGGGFHVDMTEFTEAMRKLAHQYEAMLRQLEGSTELDGSLPDGAGPVSEIVGHAFNHRLGSDGGMRYAVRTYLNHVTRIVDALNATAANYQQVEDAMTQAVAE